MDSGLINAVKTAYLDCLNLNKNENVLVLTDEETFEIGHAFYQLGQSLAASTHLLLMPVAKVNGQEPPLQIAELMQKYDVVVCPTAKSLTHTEAKRKACAGGVRVATLPGITKDVFIRTLQVDYNRVAERTYQISALLQKTDTVYIKTKLGTALKLPVKNMPVISSTGLIREKGKGGNIPSGESFLAPQEGKSEGVLVVDASIAGLGLVKSPVTVEIKNGYASSFKGNEQARQLETELAAFGKKGFNVAELGIGTNDGAIITGEVLEDEKVFGTIHVAFGNNITMGGTCDVAVHIDCVVTKPDMWFDDTQVMEQGNLIIRN
jgi:aminopeptidase